MSEYTYLSGIDSPDALKKLPREHIPELCSEIRRFLIENVSATGGHLASNLGVVELTLALHRLLRLPHDRIIWDVGHQCYVHKILTGRADRFSDLRRPGGLSGFPRRDESEYDCFGTGHSSTSLSAALGFAEADRLSGSDAYTVAVIGDGAYTGGMIHEALNNVRRNMRLIIILNENEMSISKNTGVFAHNFSRLRASKKYYTTKRKTVRFILRIPLIGRPLFRAIRAVKRALKNRIYGSNYFEQLGLYYLGPVDGNDYDRLERLITEAISAEQSVIIHIKTKKGCGYPPAEQAPDRYHCVSPTPSPVPNFSRACGELLTSFAAEKSDICAITAAMSEGTGLELFHRAFPERFFDVGIAEEHALTFAAGLAAAGMRPYIALYSSFLQRGYDNIIHDIALQRLPVVICVDRAGLNAADGATHHGIFDVAALMPVPGIRMFAPISFLSLKKALRDAYACASPCVIRYSNCGEDESVISVFPDSSLNTSGVRANFASGASPERVILTYGHITGEVLSAARRAPECGVILLERLRPEREVAAAVTALLGAATRRLLFVEEGARNGGAGMVIGELLRELSAPGSENYGILALDGIFEPLSGGSDAYAAYGLGADDILRELDGGERT